MLAAADQTQRTDPSLAAQLNLVAWRLRPGDPGVRSRLLQSQATGLLTVTPAHTDAITQIAYPNGTKTLASLDLLGKLRLWDAADPRHPRALGQPLTSIDGLALDSTARLMATSTGPIPFADNGDRSADPYLGLWDIADPAAPLRRATLELDHAGGTGSMGTLRFSPDGHLIAVIDRNNGTHRDSVQLWDVRRGDPVRAGADFAVSPQSTTTGLTSLAFRPDSAMLAVGITSEAGSHAEVQLWDITDPARPLLSATREIDHGGLSALAFAPDGHQLATAVGKTVTLWNVTDPTDPTVLVDDLATSAAMCSSPASLPAGSRSSVCYPSPRTIAFTADGRSIVAGASTGDLHTWSLPPALTATRPGADDISNFTATGARLAFGAPGRRETTVWDMGNPQAPRQITDFHSDADADATTLSPDGSMLLELELRTGTMTVVDIADPTDVHVRGSWSFPDSGALQSWSISRDFRTLATVDEDHMLRLWDFGAPPRATLLGDPMRIPDEARFTFGPDGKTMIEYETTGGGGHSESVTTLWSLADRAHPRRAAELLRHPDSEPAAITLSPDLHTMAVAVKGSLQLWDISTPQRARPVGAPITTKTLSPVTNKTLSLEHTEFTPDSHTLLIQGFDGVVWLWDITDRGHPAELATLTPAGGYSDDSALSTWTNELAAINTEGTLAVWDLDPRHAVDRICAVTGTYWTEELWRRYLPPLPYHPPCQGN